MNFLLDTNVWSELRKLDRADDNVVAWYETIAAEQVFLSVIVIGEIRRGVDRLATRDSRRAATYDRWLRELRRAYASRILPVDDRVAEEWGRMTATRTTNPTDAMLAATAKVHNMTLVTRNLAHVAGLGADVLDPFEPVRRPRGR